MLADSRERIFREISDDDVVLDVGGWASPLSRADWVIDLMPYETRGLYGEPDPDRERFTENSWVVRDICDKEPWPFDRNQFDFVICSHTLEDVRDPIWVCAELNRVAKAGYIEVPARAEEQARGVHGPWVGWSHHRWLVDVDDSEIQFVLKPHLIHGRPEFWINTDWAKSLPAAKRVSRMFWQDSFAYSEKIFLESEALHAYLRAEVERGGPPAQVSQEANGRWPPGLLRRAIKRLG